MISGLRRLAGGALRVLALVLASSAANADTVLIATTDWPPYTTPARPDQGASSAVLRAAFQAVGHEVRFEFLPWARAVHEGTQGTRAAGYFPAYDPKFIILLYTKEPGGVQYASETLTHPFMELTHFLINYYEIPPDRASYPGT